MQKHTITTTKLDSGNYMIRRHIDGRVIYALRGKGRWFVQNADGNTFAVRTKLIDIKIEVGMAYMPFQVEANEVGA